MARHRTSACRTSPAVSILVRPFPSLSLVYTNGGFCRTIGPLTDVALLSSPARSVAGRRGPPHVPKSIGNARASLLRYGAHRDKTFMGGRGHAAAHQI